MSICRWSTDDYKCDLYIYEDVAGGITTHIAGKRPVFDGELPPKLDFSWSDKDSILAWLQRDTKVQELIVDHEYIGLPHDGESFNDSTWGDLYDRVMYLRDLGYYVPNHVVEYIYEEHVDNER